MKEKEICSGSWKKEEITRHACALLATPPTAPHAENQVNVRR